jgi:hypothetical protein
LDAAVAVLAEDAGRLLKPARRRRSVDKNAFDHPVAEGVSLRLP